MLNFKNGTALAGQQDIYIGLFRDGKMLSSKQISDMEQNLWVATASKVAPSNLVLRQWALIDLFKGRPFHSESILKLLDILSYKEEQDLLIYAEGYSYFKYTMDILNVWITKFDSHTSLSALSAIRAIIALIARIEQGFIATAYIRGGVLYPAPFGDVYDEPLSPDLQILHPMKTIRISNVIMNYLESENRVWYSIEGRPIGLNTHIPVNDYTVTLLNGTPTNFRFYQGYSKKYSSAWEKFKDTANLKRLGSTPIRDWRTYH